MVALELTYFPKEMIIYIYIYIYILALKAIELSIGQSVVFRLIIRLI